MSCPGSKSQGLVAAPFRAVGGRGRLVHSLMQAGNRTPLVRHGNQIFTAILHSKRGGFPVPGGSYFR